MSITVHLKTGSVPAAGTDYDVEMRFKYNDGSFSNWCALDNDGDDREAGDTNYYDVSIPNPASVIDVEMRVRHDSHINEDAAYNAWYLEYMWIYTPSLNILYAYDGWIAVPKGNPEWHSVKLLITRSENKLTENYGLDDASIMDTSLKTEIQRLRYYAPPVFFGPWVTAASYCATSLTYSISFEPIGDTQILGEVKYFKYPNVEVTESIFSGAKITTAPANICANIMVRFKGVPTGSAVDITVEP